MAHHLHLSMYSRERVKQMIDNGASTREVMESLQKENISIRRQTGWCLECTHRTIEKLPKSGHPSKLTPAALQQNDNTMERDNEATAKELQSVLTISGISIFAKTALKGQRMLGWTRRGTAYCQMLRKPNRVKQLEWAQ